MLILNNIEERSRSGARRDEMSSRSGMASTEGAEAKVNAGGYATRVFCKKSVEVVEKKGRGAQKERKERSRVRNAMQGKGLRRGEWWRRRANMGEFTMTTATLSRHFIKPARSAE